MKLSKGIQFFAGSTQTTYDLTKLNLSAGNYAITVAAEAEGYRDSDVSNSVNYSVQAQLATPTIAMNADGKTLEITDVANATSYDVYVDGTMKTNVASAPNTTTVDLSTLSDIADGSHTVKVKAKANGYIDSEFSNEVSYTKAASQGYYITFANIAYDETISEHVFILINGEGDWIDLDNLGSLEEYNNVKFFKIYYVPNGTVTMALLNNDGSYPDNENPSLSPFDITSATSVDTAMTIPVTEGNTDFIVTVFATSAFKQINLFKLDSVNYSAIAQANINKVYTIQAGGSIYSIKKNTSGSDIWTSTSRIAFAGDGNNTETKIVFAIITGGYSGSLSYSYVNYIALEGDTEATGTDFANFTADSNANLAVWTYPPCFVENTLISTRDGTKKVQDISYDDDILVWNFDEGKLDYAKPVFIKQEQISDSYWRVTDEDGKTVNLVGSDGKSHRLYNKRTHLFEYPQDIPECKCEEIHESVKYYNIVTAYHFNCYANGILTSKRYSNMLYPITDEMKYDKTVKHTNTCKREQFNFLTDEEFEKLRLSEMEYSDEMRDEVRRFFTLKKAK